LLSHDALWEAVGKNRRELVLGNRLKVVAVALVMSAATAPARAEEGMVYIQMGGEGLTKVCRSYMEITRMNWKGVSGQTALEAGLCEGAVEMVYDSIVMTKHIMQPTEDFPASCVPGETTHNALAEVVANYLEAHPEQRSQVGYTLIRRAFAEGWPCH
jgi:hypothetical protein